MPRWPILISCVFIATMIVRISAAESYQPLKIQDAELADPVDLTVHDAARKRDIPIRVYLPHSKEPAPVVLFSHGLGGSREMNGYLGKHWAARGYVAILLQHPGSDTSVWQDKPLGQRMAAMQQAAGAENFMLRVKDVPAVLDELERKQKSKSDPFSGRLDLEHVGMSGHSFGAVTTQAVSGQSTLGRQVLTDSRIKAAIIMSPSTPKRGDADRAFSSVKIPWLLMTGTKDIAAIGGADMNSRLGVFPALPKGAKYEIVLHNAEHSAFTDRGLPGEKETRNPNHHRVILSLSTAFWDAYLKNDDAAKAWLDGEGAKSVLEPDDRWQLK